MKKIYFTTALAALMAVGVSAQQPIEVANRQYVTKASYLQRVGEADEQLVKDQPAGTYYNDFTRSATVYFVGYGGYMSSYFYESLMGEIVEADNGDLWLKNPILYFETDTWVKLEKEGDGKYVLHTPVYVYTYNHQDSETGEVTTVKDYLYKFSVDENAVFDYPADGDIHFTWDGSTLACAEGSNVGFALMQDDGENVFSWEAWADVDMKMKKITEPSYTSIPEDAEVQDVPMMYQNYSGTQMGKVVRVARSGNDFYLTGFEYQPEGSWIKGTLKDGKVTFAKRQYLGQRRETTTNHTFQQFFYTYYTKKVNEPTQYNPNFMKTYYYFADDMVLDFNEEDFSLRGDTVSMAIGRASGNDATKVDRSYSGIQLKPSPASPVTPELAKKYGYPSENVEGGYYLYVPFKIPAFGVDGWYLDENNMYYNVYVDGELFTFEPDEYANLTEPLTDVPYTFRDIYTDEQPTGYDIRWNGQDQFGIYFYAEGINKVEIKVFNAYNGQVASNEKVAVYERVTDGITNAVANGDARVKEVSFFDLTGRQVAAPAKGVYVKTVKLDNGQTVSSKVVVK